MSQNIAITDTVPIHLRIMSNAMREENIETARQFGIQPLKALWKNYRSSLICKSVFINDNLCAIFGILGSMCGEVGRPWICMTPETEEYPMRIAFRFKAELRKMKEMFPVLEDYIDETNEKSLRFMELMGFKISKNKIKVGETNLIQAIRSV
jgi:hypothetical protein